MSTTSETAHKPDAGRIFRKRALQVRRQRISDESLQELPRIIPPFGWLTLAGILVFILGALVWSLIGSVPTTLTGQGIILRGGQISSITAQGQGQIEQILVRSGDPVKPGQVVAKVRQPTLQTQIDAQKRIVENLRARLKTVQDESSSLLKSQKAYVAKQRSTVQSAIKDYDQQIQSLQKVVDAQQKLLSEGLIPLTTLLESRTLLDTTQINMLASMNQLQMLETTELTNLSTAEANTFQAQLNLETEEATLQQLEAEFNQGAAVVSTIEGVIVGVNVSIGQDVTPGQAVFGVEPAHEDMTAVLFFPAGVAKRIVPGMIAQTSPETVPVDQYGFILGKVTHVADVPATPGSMMAFLANENLVQTLTMFGPQLQVLATLEKDPKTKSGYKWSSSDGPPTTVPAGTMVTARVIVEEQRPIELVIPLLKRFFGIID